MMTMKGSFVSVDFSPYSLMHILSVLLSNVLLFINTEQLSVYSTVVEILIFVFL